MSASASAPLPSQAVTRDIRITVRSRFSPEHSDPDSHRFFYLYEVEIANQGGETVQLLSRHWIINDALGNTEEVKGPGVVGEQPVLPPGKAFQYVSGCPLPTSFGVMHGTYQMVVQSSGERFDAKIPAFALGEPSVVH